MHSGLILIGLIPKEIVGTCSLLIMQMSQLGTRSSFIQWKPQKGWGREIMCWLPFTWRRSCSRHVVETQTHYLLIIINPPSLTHTHTHLPHWPPPPPVQVAALIDALLCFIGDSLPLNRARRRRLLLRRRRIINHHYAAGSIETNAVSAGKWNAGLKKDGTLRHYTYTIPGLRLFHCCGFGFQSWGINLRNDVIKRSIAPRRWRHCRTHQITLKRDVSKMMGCMGRYIV